MLHFFVESVIEEIVRYPQDEESSREDVHGYLHRRNRATS